MEWMRRWGEGFGVVAAADMGRLYGGETGRRSSAFGFTSGRAFRIRPHDILRNKRTNDILFHFASEENRFRMEIIVSTELKLPTLLDLYVNYGSWNSAADSSNDSLPHRWLQRNNYKILLWRQCVSLEGSSRFPEAPEMLDRVNPRRSPSNETCAPPANSSIKA